MDKMRNEFEEWVVSEFYYDVSKTGNGTYHELKTFIAWESWKASRASLCVELPEGDGGSQDTNLIAVEIALDNAGVSYK